MKLSTSKSLLSTAFVLLCAAFALHVRDGVDKYLQGRTTTTVNEEHFDKLLLPTLAICPGYRHHMPHAPHRLPSYFASEEARSIAATEEGVLEWWRNATFDLDEVADRICIGGMEVDGHGFCFDDGDKVLVIRDENIMSRAADDDGEEGEGSLTIREVSTVFGRCFLLESDTELAAKDFLFMDLDLSALPLPEVGISAFVFPRGAETGLQSNHWAADSFYLRMRGGESHDIHLRKKMRRRLEKKGKKSGRGCREYSEEEYHGCIKEWGRRQFNSMNCTKVCRIPQSSLFSDPPSQPLCLTEGDSDCAGSHYRAMYRKQAHSATTGCPEPCVREEYEVNIRLDVPLVPAKDVDMATTKEKRNRLNRYAQVYLFYYDTVVSHHEEYLLFDLGAIVTSVGGSLGLFLGFSCWQCAVVVAKRVCSDLRVV